MIAFAAILVVASGASLVEYGATGDLRIAAVTAGVSWLIVGLGALVAVWRSESR